MRLLALLVLLLLSGWGGLTRIHDRNEAVQAAQRAYQRGDFGAAASLYRKAVQQLGTTDETVLLNLGHASARAGLPAEARAAYGRLLTSRTPAMRSVAQQQLAVLATARGDYAQALSLLRQALLANPANTGARYNYEVVSDYLARRQDDPGIPPPATTDNPEADSNPDKKQDPTRQPQPREGRGQQNQLDDPTRPQDPRNAPQQRPDQRGQRDAGRPSRDAGNSADGGIRPGQGLERPMARGTEPGNTRGFSDEATGPEAPNGSSRRTGTEAAALDEAQLQTQRTRLQQMNLSTGQARQLLEALNAAEQQYLQQLPRPSTKKPDPNKPAW
jgi:tetratricopeptide (TPR) repeat protein